MTMSLRNASSTLTLALLGSTAIAQPLPLTISGRLDMSVANQRLSGGPNMSFVSSDTSYISFQGRADLGGAFCLYQARTRDEYGHMRTH
jgi:hypothetical protein